MNVRADSGRFFAHITILGLLLTTQVVFLSLPDALVETFVRMCRPLLYAGATIFCFVFFGKDEHTVVNGRRGVQAAVFGAALYVMAMLAAGILFGFGRNSMAPGLAAVLGNLWIYAVTAVLSEILRLKLISGTPSRRRAFLTVVLTLVYTFVQLDSLRRVANLDAHGLTDLIFTVFFPALALNSVLSFMAFGGSLRTLLILRCTFSLLPVLLPILPNLSKAIWSVLSSAMLFITVVVYHLAVNGKSIQLRRLAKRRAGVPKKPIWFLLVSVTFSVLLAAFILRGFAVYPVVVLTGSMKGAIEPGAVMIVEKLRPENVRDTVLEGDIIQFTYGSKEVIHRVAECRCHASGERFYITKGDANPAADINPVELSQVVGIVRASIPYIGYPFVLVNTIIVG